MADLPGAQLRLGWYCKECVDLAVEEELHRGHFVTGDPLYVVGGVKPDIRRLIQTSRPAGHPSASQSQHVVGGDRFRQALERELAKRLGLNEILDRAQDALAYQDLAGLGLGTEAGGEICHGADGGIVEAALEADLTECRIALGDADTKSQLADRAFAIAP